MRSSRTSLFYGSRRALSRLPRSSFATRSPSAKGLFCSKWFVIGFSVAIAAWGLHVAALALAPISLVQAVISGGLVFLAVLADRWFGFKLGRRQWCGVAFVAAGLHSLV